MVDKLRIENAIKEILYAIGEQPEREGLLETPDRVARMYEEIFSGLYTDPNSVIKTFKEKNHEEMILVKDIPLYSVCEHHLLPFIGVANVVYIPNDGKVIGLSKIARVVDMVARKPQLQERISYEIADILMKNLNPFGVAVIIEAEHLCVTMRGIKKAGSKTVTSVLRGSIKNDARTRSEVMSLLNSNKISI